MEKTPWNPSIRAIKKVKDPLPAPTKCHYCAGSIAIVSHKAVYGQDFGNWPWLYICTTCRAYVGMHPFTDIPLGTLANEETRAARKSCKPHFERIWKSGKLTRTDAYKWLAEKLGIDPGECHFGWFDVDMCEQAKNVCMRFK
ncbi:zinc-finger-containing protein [Xenorhabdus santafensis]|uniref:zinc-finger-containing protein n=1 Tax=Xenorhabdus santafensis TaxID=2582833 RepID=UPI0029E817F4|nr:zinc-finger-containing protein [Xenorhabdus sp. 12]